MTKTILTTSTISSAPATSGTNPATEIPGSLGSYVGKNDLLASNAVHIAYPYYLFKGRIPVTKKTFKARPCQQIRIRFINNCSDKAFRIALVRYSMKVTGSDVYPVVPRPTPC